MPQRQARIRAAAPAALAGAVLVGLLLVGPRPSHAYIDLPLPSLAALCKDANRGTEAIAVLRVERVNRERRGIVFRKVRDLKGNFPAGRRYFGDTFTHVIRESANDWLLFKPHNHMDPNRLELQNQAILAWAAEGKTAVLFERGGEQAVCVGHLWYTARPAVSGGRPGSPKDIPYRSDRDRPPAQEQWVYGGASDPRFARLFCGDVDELVSAVTDLLAGKTDVTVPRMVGTAEMLSDRTGPVLRFRADREEFPDRGGFTPDARPRKGYYTPFADQAPWSTHRGDPQRTGSDGGPGPVRLRVLWAYRSSDHFVAPLAPGAEDLYASSLGAFNAPGFHALALDPAGDRQPRWSKGPPLLRQPIAGAPAQVRAHTDLLVFGDGFHTDGGGSLRCLRASDGFPLWQLPVAGNLVHFEGTPTFAGGRLYAGGGNAGVVCLDPSRVTFEGKEQDLRAVQPVLEQRWKDLLTAYEIERKKDPQFALAPDEGMLPQPAPKQLWQQGQGRWHVDAPVAVVGDRVLAASAYLDDEKAGERALVCLRAADGGVAWTVPLRLNPWAGPTVGPYVLVGCSSIRLDPKGIPGATGEVVAVELDTGRVRWRREVPGGVLSPVAVREGLAVFTATDGKVRAWDAFTGADRWAYEAGAPFFTGVSVAENVVYTADIKGAVHAIGLEDGRRRGLLDLGTDPAVGAAVMVYGSPVVQGGRLYLATCSLGDGAGRATNAVVCVVEK
jgi:outer membrane protein assembly factor BamB